MAEDIELIKGFKEDNDTDCLKKIISKHSGIYVDMVNKYIPDAHEGIYKQDILEDKDYCIYNAVINYDESKNTKFSTYLGNLAKWKCLNIYNKKNKFPQEPILEFAVGLNTKHSKAYTNKLKECRQTDDKLTISFDRKSIEQKENLKNIYKFVDNLPDSRARKIFKLRYASGKKLTPWKKIAKKLDLSIQGCINIHNKYLTEIKNYVQ